MNNPEVKHVSENQEWLKKLESTKPKEAWRKIEEANTNLAEALKKVESSEQTKEKFKKRREAIDSNVKLKRSEVPDEVFQSRLEATKKLALKDVDITTLSQEELEERTLDQMSRELSIDEKESLVYKRMGDYDKKETFTVTKDWKEFKITETRFQHLQREKPEIKAFIESLWDEETAKELLAIYGEDKMEWFADVLKEKWVKSVEEAEEVIKKETLKRAKEMIQTDKDWNPLTQAEKDKIARQIEQNMNADPNYASQMASKMAQARWISEAQAHNVQPEALNLTWTARERTLNLIKHFEWFTSRAFWDYKQWTRWYGTKAPWAWATISKEKASQELEQKINTRYNLKAELSKRSLWNLYEKLWDNQIAALTSFIFNLWPGKLSNLKPALQKYEQTWDTKAVTEKMLQFNKAWWKTLAWLVRRRKTEAKLFEEWAKKKQKDQKVETSKVA